MSSSNQSAAFGIGGIGVLIAIAAVAFRSAPIETRVVDPAASAANAGRVGRASHKLLRDVPSAYGRGRRLLAEYLGTDWESIERASEKRGPRAIPLRIVIATLPDPFDSYLDWSFDADVEALRRAFGTAGYVPQNYWLPQRGDSLYVTEGRAAGAYSVHDFNPGVFLFRSTKPDSISLALLYIVPELPSSGLHKMAFEAALRERAAIMTKGSGVFAFSTTERGQLSVIGPTFSGSSASLRLMLDSLPSLIDPCTRAARTVSGSATSFSNQRVLSDADTVVLGAQTACATPIATPVRVPHLRYTATVNPDEAMDDLLTKLIDSLKVKEHQVAVLSEFGTQYGARDTLAVTDTQSVSAVQAAGVSTGNSAGNTDTTAQRRKTFLTVTFPMNIGSLRAEYARTPASDAPGAGVPQIGSAPRTRIALEDNLRPREFPPLTSRLTVPTADVVLSATMRTLREHGIRLVVVRATDVRDKLMLVRELRRSLHDVMIVSYESNILLRHPEYSQTLRGSLVLSSYPMLLENQFWSTSQRKNDSTFTQLRNLTSFPNDASIGVYNAALTLLDRPAERVEYTLLGASAGQRPYTRPPVWLSVVGIDGFYPLRSDTASTVWQQYVEPGVPMADVNAGNALVHEHAYGSKGFVQSIMLIAPALALAIILCLMSFVSANAPRKRIGLPKVFSKPANSRQQLFLCLLGLSLASSYLPFAVAVESRRIVGSMDTVNSGPSWALWTVIALLVVGVGASLLAVGRGIFKPAALRRFGESNASSEPSDRHTPAEALVASSEEMSLFNAEMTRREPRFVALAGVAMIAIACAAFAYGSFRYTWQLLAISSSGGVQATFSLYRALHLTSGVSPITPLVLLGLAFASWTWWQLQQSRLFDESSKFECAMRELAREMNARAIWRRSYRAIVSARRGLTWFAPSNFVWPIVATLLVGIWFVGRTRTPSLEVIADASGADWPFDLALWMGILSVVTASAWAIYRLLHSWNGIERFLDIVAGTPVASAFGRLPLDVARLTDVGFLGFRRDSGSDNLYLDELWTRAINDASDARDIRAAKANNKESSVSDKSTDKDAKAVDRAVGAIVPAAAKPVDVAMQPDSLILERTNTRISELLREAPWSSPASASSIKLALKTLLVAWEAARTRPDPFKEHPIEEPKLAMPNARALRTLEEYVAFEILLYIEMYLLNLRRLCFFLFASLLVLVVLSSEYPYEPHSIVSVATIILLLATVGAIFFVMIRMSRSSTLSRIAHTEPGKITWDTSFILKLLTFCVLPILALASSEFPQVRALLFAWMDPLARALGHV